MLNFTPFFVLFAALIAIAYAAYQYVSVKKKPEGTDQMKAIGSKIRLGAMAYLKRQYKTVGVFFGVMVVILLALAAIGYLTWFVPFAFLTGGFFSGLSGFVGMKIATYANTRTANASRESLNGGLKVAFASGTVMGLTVVGLGLFDVSVWFILLKYVFKLEIEAVMSAMLTFGMGASSMALFARVGGGIFTKAADVGADLVGKVEANIPEDDPRNPACIADNVGDNVGDVAGMGADLYESYVGSIISAAALGVSAFAGDIKAMALPLILAALGIIASIIGGLLGLFIPNFEQLGKSYLLGYLLFMLFVIILCAVITSNLRLSYAVEEDCEVVIEDDVATVVHGENTVKFNRESCILASNDTYNIISVKPDVVGMFIPHLQESSAYAIKFDKDDELYEKIQNEFR